jgi:agmatine/peptidylarginine deiminase
MMRFRRLPIVLGVLCVTGVGLAQVLEDDALVYPEGSVVPRGLTDIERAYQAGHPIESGRTPPPTGPIRCVAEYEPMDGILIAWESFSTTQRQMVQEITTTGDADVYISVDSTSERSSVTSTLTSDGVDMNRVHFIIAPTDTVWIRDYGPRYIYQGGCRAIIDHTYNRPRYNDNDFPGRFSTYKHHAYYEIPLVHGGGNFHLDALGRSYATELIANENPGLTEAQIIDYWLQYQNVQTTITDAYPTYIDSTQHIDMWMQIVGDNTVIISDWPNNAGSTQDQICDNMTTWMTSLGYQVFRTPARSVYGTHYTYTNMVLCNDLVLLPYYTNSQVSGHNAPALAAVQAAMPGKTIVQINCETIIQYAGAVHCIVMHVPEPLGGAIPSAYVLNLNDGPQLVPGDIVDIQWITDDDEGVQDVDLLLSTNGGASYDTTIASHTADTGLFVWTVPDIYTHHAMIRVVARDGDTNTGHDDTDMDFMIVGTCPPDFDHDGSVNSLDFIAFLNAFTAGDLSADFNGDDSINSLDFIAFLNAFGAGC